MTGPGDAAQPQAWDVLCLTCGWQHNTRPNPTPLLTEKEAWFFAEAHECPKRIQTASAERHVDSSKNC